MSDRTAGHRGKYSLSWRFGGFALALAVSAGCAPDTPVTEVFTPQGGVLGALAFSSTTAAVTTAYPGPERGERRQLVAYEGFAGALDATGSHIRGSSTVRYAWSDDDGTSWRHGDIPAPTDPIVGIHTLVGDLALATTPRLPPLNQGNSVVFMFMVGLGGSIQQGGIERRLGYAASIDAGRTFSSVKSVTLPDNFFVVEPSGLSAAFDAGGSVAVAYLSRATTPEAGIRVITGSVDVSLNAITFSPPVNPVIASSTELQQVRRVLLRDGAAGPYLLVERVEVLPAAEWTSRHNAKLHLSMYRRNALNGGWEFAGSPTGGTVLTFANVQSNVGELDESSHVDFQRTLDQTRATAGIANVLIPLLFDGRSHLVWTGHDANDSGSDQVWYRSFSSAVVGAQGVQDTFRVRVRISQNQGGRVFQPTVSAAGTDVFVTWYEQAQGTLRTRLLGRRSHNNGLDFEPIVVLSEIGQPSGASESLCPTADTPLWSRFSTSLSYVDTFISGSQTNPSIDPTATALTFYTRGRDVDCSMQTMNTTLYQEAAVTRWR